MNLALRGRLSDAIALQQVAPPGQCPAPCREKDGSWAQPRRM